MGKENCSSDLSRAQKTSSRNGSYWHSIGSEPLLHKTLGQCVDEAAEKYGDREALVSLHEGLRFSFKDIRDQSDKLAAGFYHIGLRPGDRLGIWMPNYSSWYLTMTAAAKIGLILVGLNPAYQILELEYCLKKAEIKCIVTQPEYKILKFYEILLKVVPELENSEAGKIKSTKFPYLTTIIMVDENTQKNTYRYKDLLSVASNKSIEEASKLKIDPDSALNIQFTSGTTGEPKATYLSHFSIINNGYLTGKRYDIASKCNKICVQVPFFHAFGVAGTISPFLQHGATLVLPGPTYNASESLKAIEKEKCTITNGTPTMFVDIIAIQKILKCCIESWDLTIIGGASCSPNLIKQILGELKVGTIGIEYGLTESTAVVFQTYPKDSIDKIINTVGHIQDHLEVKVIDKYGHVVPFGQPGELCVRGYVNMLGYWKDEEKTREMVGEDGWLKTGDQFILREDGYGCVVGRYKEMIIRGGENIFPKEIEDFLNTHPDIIESQVIGVPNERLGEEVCAFVRVANGKEINNDVVKQFCQDKIAYFKIPKYVIQTDVFPKTASGKVQKFKLQEMFTKSNLQKET